MFAFSAVQGIMEPITPTGRDVLIAFFTSLSRIFQPHTTTQSQGVALVAAERLWLNFTGAFRHKMGRKMMLGGMGLIEPSTRQALESLLDDPRLAIVPRRIRPISLLRLGRFVIGMGGGMVISLIRPDSARQAALDYMEQELVQLKSEFELATDLSQQVDLLSGSMLTQVKDLFPYLLPRIGGGLGMLARLSSLAREVPGGEQLALEVTRGLPHNVTTEMDLVLWDTSQAIRSDAVSLASVSRAGRRIPCLSLSEWNAPPCSPGCTDRFSRLFRHAGTRGNRLWPHALA